MFDLFDVQSVRLTAEGCANKASRELLFFLFWFTQAQFNNTDGQEWLLSFYYVCLVLFLVLRFLLRRLIMPLNTCRAHVSVFESDQLIQVAYLLSPEVGFMHKFALSRTNFA